jgi:hypothetical protein
MSTWTCRLHGCNRLPIRTLQNFVMHAVLSQGCSPGALLLALSFTLACLCRLSSCSIRSRHRGIDIPTDLGCWCVVMAAIHCRFGLSRMLS